MNSPSFSKFGHLTTFSLKIGVTHFIIRKVTSFGAKQAIQIHQTNTNHIQAKLQKFQIISKTNEMEFQ